MPPEKPMRTSSSHRYYCASAQGPSGHCDDRRNTIQCDYCIWYESLYCIQCGQPKDMCLCDDQRYASRRDNSP